MKSVQPTTSSLATASSTRSESNPTASTSGRSIVSADHRDPPCERFEDNSNITVLSYPPLSARDIAHSDKHTDTQTRALLGGKGLFLSVMQQANIPVPPFTVVDIPLVAAVAFSAGYWQLERGIMEPETTVYDRYRTPPSATIRMVKGVIWIYCQRGFLPTS